MSRGRFVSPYSSAWARLVENVAEEDHGMTTPCWIGRDETDRCGYQRVHAYIPGLTGGEGGNARRHLMAHIVAFVVHHLNALGTGTLATWNDIWLGCLEVRESGCELDHACGQPGCRNPTHLALLDRETHRAETARRAQARSRQRREDRELTPATWEEVEEAGF